jgi:hypothetical protein
MLEIDVKLSIDRWHKIISENSRNKDIIIISESIDDLIWFSTNYTQFLIREGENEVLPLYGNLINDLETFCYQINCCMPFGYRIKDDEHALYDLLLNFETEPKCRYIIWNDTQNLLRTNQPVFFNIATSMITAAYCNRNGLSTIKEDGDRYMVEQKNIFVFHNTVISELDFLVQPPYYIPSIDGATELKLDFQVFKLVENASL